MRRGPGNCCWQRDIGARAEHGNGVQDVLGKRSERMAPIREPAGSTAPEQAADALQHPAADRDLEVALHVAHIRAAPCAEAGDARRVAQSDSDD